MIVTMKKITLVMLDEERRTALSSLRDLGVLHIEKRTAASHDVSELQAQLSRIDQCLGVLSEIKPEKGRAPSASLDRNSALSLVDSVFILRDEKRSAIELIARNVAEIERLSPWGEVDPSSFNSLADQGIYLFPLEMSVASYAKLADSVKTVLLSKEGKVARCVLVQEDDLLPESLPADAVELALPEISTAEMKAQVDSARASLPRIEKELAEYALNLASIEALKREITAELEFETVRAGMESIELSASKSGSLAWLTGYVPTEDVHLVKQAAASHGWALLSDDPSEEDLVPTKIRNNRVVNLISPLLEFLGTVPGYRELDISLWFLLFFGIFFAMIFGDAGYGSLLVLISSGLIVSSLRKGKKVATGLVMFLYLGLMTVVWGVITCTWFGIPAASLPDALRSIALPAFSNENPDSATNIKIFCFTLGLIQISLAHVIGVFRYIKSFKSLGELGSLMMTIGMYFVVLNLVVDAQKYPLTNVVLGLIGVGFLLNFVFINYDGSLGKGILESLKNIITMLLGIVNMFGDIMSYIRLWAVGLAGSAISATINSMAGPFLGGFIIFAALLILFFGHGLNFVMNALSVIVHGVRLNTLEFSNHLGLTWSGFKYEPFAKAVEK